MVTNTGVINVRGREYKTVAARVQEFRAIHPIDEGWGIVTEVLLADADLVRAKATITDPQGRVIATGHAEEHRSSNTREVNYNSAVENAETSAIGRALAAAGFAGTEYASADELTRKLNRNNTRYGREERAARPAALPAPAETPAAEERSAAQPWWERESVRSQWSEEKREFADSLLELARNNPRAWEDEREVWQAATDALRNHNVRSAREFAQSEPAVLNEVLNELTEQSRKRSRAPAKG